MTILSWSHQTTSKVKWWIDRSWGDSVLRGLSNMLTCVNVQLCFKMPKNTPFSMDPPGYKISYQMKRCSMSSNSLWQSGQVRYEKCITLPKVFFVKSIPFKIFLKKSVCLPKSLTLRYFFSKNLHDHNYLVVW